MRAFKGMQFGLALLAAVGCCLPEVAWGAPVATPPSTLPPIADVRLEEGGLLAGQLVTPQNIAVAGAGVALWSGRTKLATTKTDERGCFAFTGLRGGLYQLETPKGLVPYRIWSKEAAPPAAQRGVLIVMGDKTVLAQYSLDGGQFLRNTLSNPWVVAAIVATAIAVPVAIHNSRDSHPSSP